jgi:hypothetical protein
MEEIDKLRQQNKELTARIAEQDELIKNMRDVLRFCARSSVGTFYQQQSAKEMLLNSRKIVWDRCNPDGTYNDEYKKWIFECGGQEALDANAKEEEELR